MSTPTYIYMYTARRLDFECEILLIANCEFLYNMQSKESQEKEYAMNEITRGHTPFAQVRALDCKHVPS